TSLASLAFSPRLCRPLSLSHDVVPFILLCLFFFFFNDPAPTEIYTLSLHDALPILLGRFVCPAARLQELGPFIEEGFSRESPLRSEEHTSELQSLTNLVCRLLLEKKKKISNPACLITHQLVTHDKLVSTVAPQKSRI